MARTSGIYVIRNIIDGKMYVGSAVNLRRRRNAHIGLLRTGKHHNVHLQRAWVKHGEGTFEWIILERCTEGVLIEREQWWLTYYAESYGWTNLYNLCPVAGSRLGVRHSLETRVRMSKVKSVDSLSPETRTNISKAKLGHKVSLETRDKISTALKGRSLPPEIRAKISIGMTGRKLSPETRIKMSAARKGEKRMPLSQEHKAKISVALKGRIFSPEHRTKLSESQRRRCSH